MYFIFLGFTATVVPVALSSSLPSGPKVGRSKATSGPGSRTKKMTRADVDAIRKENDQLREQGLLDKAAEAEFEAMALQVDIEEGEPPRKKKKLSAGVELLARMAESVHNITAIQEVIFFYIRT